MGNFSGATLLIRNLGDLQMNKKQKDHGNDLCVKELRGSLNRRDAAAYLSISTRLLDTLASAGHIPRIKIGAKTLFRVIDLDTYLESKIEHVKGKE